MRSLYLWLGGSLLAAAITLNVAAAQRYESPNYTIDASVGNSFGGTGTSASYELVSSGGESIIGNGAGGSYMLTEGYVSQLEQGLQVTVQPQGLGAYYAFEETAGGLAFDGSANDNNGTLVASPTRQTGKVGNGVAFDGSNHVSVPHSSSVSPSGDMTIELWANLTNDANYQPLVSKTPLEYEVAADFRTGSTSLAWRSTGGSTTTNFSNFFDGYTGNFVHIAVTLSGNTVTAYRNGVEFGTLTIVARSTSSSELNIGKRSGESFWADGVLDEVKIFDRALSGNEVNAEYVAGQAGNVAGLSFPGDLIAGASRTTAAEVVVQTDAPGYTLAINQDNDLSDGSNTIPAIAGTIASPLSWSEGTTKGLGFTVVSSNATSVPAKWNAGNSYARLPGSSTEFYTRTGFSGGTKDLIDVRYRVDVTSTQVAGKYSNQVMYTGTITP